MRYLHFFTFHLRLFEITPIDRPQSVLVLISPCLPRVQQGQALMESKPEFEPVVRERLAKLHELWERLESTTQEKARLLFDANRSELFDQSLADMKKWLGELQQQLQSGDEDAVKDLTNANILLKKHQVRSLVYLFSSYLTRPSVEEHIGSARKTFTPIQVDQSDWLLLV